jgi:hypothetical protein
MTRKRRVELETTTRPCKPFQQNGLKMAIDSSPLREQMTSDESMTKFNNETMTNAECLGHSFVIRIWDFFRHWCLVISHSAMWVPSTWLVHRLRQIASPR